MIQNAKEALLERDIHLLEKHELGSVRYLFTIAREDLRKQYIIIGWIYLLGLLFHLLVIYLLVEQQVQVTHVWFTIGSFMCVLVAGSISSASWFSVLRNPTKAFSYPLFDSIAFLLVIVSIVLQLVVVVDFYYERNPLFSISTNPLFLSVGSGAVWYIILPSFTSQRLIACEKGMLQTKKILGMYVVEVVYWQDIVALPKLHENSSYTIYCRPGMKLTCSAFYRNRRRLLEIVEQKTGLREQEYVSLKDTWMRKKD